MLDVEKKEMYKQLSEMTYIEMLHAEDDFVVKSAELSSKARQKGNLLYQQKNHDSKIHEQIWEKYSKSIALAPNKSNELALGYGNRSALLFHLQKYEDCIKDIDRAISISDSNCFKLKLICRKVKCQAHLNLPDEEELKVIEYLTTKINEKKGEKKTVHDIVNKTISYRDESKFIDSSEEKETKIFTLKNVVNDFSSVAVKYDDQKGKYLIATRDLDPGEVIFLETPYATIMDFKKAYAFCTHCLEQCWSLMPCQGCHLCMFCSDKCREEAWVKYHDIECTLFNNIQTNSQLDLFYQLGIRTLIQGVREAGSITKLEAQLRSSNNANPLSPYIKDGNVQSLGFISVYNLRSYIVQPVVKILSKFCSFVALLLAKRTNFFGKQFTWIDGITLLKNSNFIFVAALLLKLTKMNMGLCRSIANKHIFYKEDSVKFLDFGYCTRGAYISSIGALTNHSCNPNVGRSCIAVNEIALYALTPIKKNSQLYEAYCSPFYEVPKDLRTQHLIITHQNYCNCLACQNDWPPFMMTCEEHENVPTHTYANAFYKGEIENEIYRFSEEAIRLSGYEESLYREDLLQNLAKGITKCMKSLPQPSMLTYELIIALKKIFDRLYGLKFTIPVKCIEA